MEPDKPDRLTDAVFAGNVRQYRHKRPPETRSPGNNRLVQNNLALRRTAAAHAGQKIKAVTIRIHERPAKDNQKSSTINHPNTCTRTAHFDMPLMRACSGEFDSGVPRLSAGNAGPFARHPQIGGRD